MSKEALKIGVDLGTEKDEQCAVIILHYDGIDHIIYETHDKEQIEALNKIKQQESIDNAEPSEALECVEVLKEDGCITTLYQGKALETIRQALLKSQEPKKYLKWEDLKFPYGVWKNAKVVLNGKELGIRYKSDYGFMDCDYKVVKIFNLETGKCICKIYDKDKDFFNNLHLEFEKECSNCKKQHTNDCPNSSECYSKKDKPYWERVEE